MLKKMEKNKKNELKRITEDNDNLHREISRISGFHKHLSDSETSDNANETNDNQELLQTATTQLESLSQQMAMMTSSNGNIFRVTGHLCGEFTGSRGTQRPVTRSFDVFFDPRLNKRLSKQSWGWWFETLPRPLWRNSNGKWQPHCYLVWQTTTIRHKRQMCLAISLTLPS